MRRRSHDETCGTREQCCVEGPINEWTKPYHPFCRHVVQRFSRVLATTGIDSHGARDDAFDVACVQRSVRHRTVRREGGRSQSLIPYVTSSSLSFKTPRPAGLPQQSRYQSLPQPDPHTHPHHAQYERGHQSERCANRPPQRAHEGRDDHDQELLHGGSGQPERVMLLSGDARLDANATVRLSRGEAMQAHAFHAERRRVAHQRGTWHFGRMSNSTMAREPAPRYPPPPHGTSRHLTAPLAAR